MSIDPSFTKIISNMQNSLSQDIVMATIFVGNYKGLVRFMEERSAKDNQSTMTKWNSQQLFEWQHYGGQQQKEPVGCSG